MKVPLSIKAIALKANHLFILSQRSQSPLGITPRGFFAFISSTDRPIPQKISPFVLGQHPFQWFLSCRVPENLFFSRFSKKNLTTLLSYLIFVGIFCVLVYLLRFARRFPKELIDHDA